MVRLVPESLLSIGGLEVFIKMPQSGLGSMQWKTRGGHTHSVNKCTDRQGGKHPQCYPTNGHTPSFWRNVTYKHTELYIEAACCLKTLRKVILIGFKLSFSCFFVNVKKNNSSLWKILFCPCFGWSLTIKRKSAARTNIWILSLFHQQQIIQLILHTSQTLQSFHIKTGEMLSNIVMS